MTKQNIRVVFKPAVTLSQYLIHNKHRTPWNDKYGAIYHIPFHECEQVMFVRQVDPHGKEHKKLKLANIIEVGYDTQYRP